MRQVIFDMKAGSLKTFWQALSLGLLAGMRTTSATAIVSHLLSNHPSSKLSGSPLKFIQSEKTAIAFKILCLGELVGDKLPFVPNRTEPGSVTARCLSGGLAGASIFKANNSNALIGGLIGAAAAFSGTLGSYFLRKVIVKKSGIFGPSIRGF